MPAQDSHGYIAEAMAHLAVFNPAVRTLDESVLRAKISERLGFRSVWTTQMPDARDASLLLAAYAHATERVTLGTGVLPIYTRHPTAMAHMAARSTSCPVAGSSWASASATR